MWLHTRNGQLWAVLNTSETLWAFHQFWTTADKAIKLDLCSQVLHQSVSTDIPLPLSSAATFNGKTITGEADKNLTFATRLQYRPIFSKWQQAQLASFLSLSSVLLSFYPQLPPQYLFFRFAPVPAVPMVPSSTIQRNKQLRWSHQNTTWISTWTTLLTHRICMLWPLHHRTFLQTMIVMIGMWSYYTQLYDTTLTLTPVASTLTVVNLLAFILFHLPFDLFIESQCSALF